MQAVEAVAMPRLNNQALMEQYRQPPGPPRFAEPISVQITPSQRGTWETVDDQRVWRLRITSPGARSINLGFTHYHMPPDGRLYVYGPEYEPIVGPFTAADNEAHGELWTPPLPRDEVIIEVTVPADQRPDVQLTLGQVNHGFRSLKSLAAQSGDCNVDVACPEANGWENQIRAVGTYSLNGVRLCSGVLINNTARDQTPYFLTANHCGITPNSAPSMIVYWNYENSTCRPIGDSGGPGDGTLDQFSTGAIHRAGYEGEIPGIAGGPDFTLVELDDPINPTFNVFYAGWSRRDMAPSRATTIHHPEGEEKRISFENDPLTVTSYISTDSSTGPTHLRVGDWDLGTTEPGSSGSPLFNANKRVVGILSGGYAACGNDEPDWYGRLAVAWEGGGTSDTRLRDWLDPLGTGASTLDGIGSQGDATPPAPIPDFSIAHVTREGVTLQWTATGDDDREGTAALYDLRYATSPIVTQADFEDATSVSGVPSPQKSGSSETITVEDLVPETPYYFALIARDNAGNASPLAFTFENAVILRKAYVLKPPYPNPFQSTVTVRFAVEQQQPVRIALYDILGRRVQVAYDERPPENALQEVQIQGRRLASGTYFIRLRGETFNTFTQVVRVR